MRSIRSPIFSSYTVPFLPPIFAGSAVAVVVSLVLYGLKPVLVPLFLVGLAVLIPSFLVKDVQLYWMCVFLFVLQFDFKITLGDGLAVLDSLKIDYMQYVFVPEIRLSDLPLLALLLAWAHKVGFQRKNLTMPRQSWFALAFLGWAAVSAVKAPHFDLSAIELVRQCKFFLIYLYVANNIDSRRMVKVILIVLASTLLVQAAVTLSRYHYDYFEPIQSFVGIEDPGSEFGEGGLKIDSTAEDATFGPSKRSFGSLSSPGSTAKYTILIFPIALMLCLRNPWFQRRWVFVFLVIAGTVTLYFTFSRSFLIAYLAEIVLFYWYGLRRGYIPTRIAVYLLCAILLTGVFASPTLYDFMNSRYENVLVRLRQYEVTMDMIKSNPILGVGINNSTGVKKTMTDDSFFVRDPLRRSGDQPIHSFYLTLMAETGLVGFLCYIGFFTITYRNGLALSCSSRDKEIAFASTILLICVAGLAIGLLTDPLFEDYVQTLLWLYAGMVVALKRLDQDGVRKMA